jgi:hypothetical protein
MKKLFLLPILVLAVVLVARAEDAAKPAAKPDLLKTCPVSGEKLDGDKGCKKDFDKTPDKFIKLIRAADATAKK